MWSKLFQTDFERKDGGIAYLGRRHLLSRLMPKHKFDKTLDLGCGDGKLLRELKSKGNMVVGVDISFKDIKKARERIKEEGLDNIHFVVADAQKLPFKNDSFDFLLCSEVLEHVAEPNKVLSEISRIVINNKNILISIPSFSVARLPKFYFVQLLKKLFMRSNTSIQSQTHPIKECTKRDKRDLYEKIVAFFNQHPTLLHVANRLPLLYALKIILGKENYSIDKLTWCDRFEHLREYSFFNAKGYINIKELERSFKEHGFVIKGSEGGHMLIDFFYQIPLIHEITAELPRMALPFKIIAAILIRLDASILSHSSFKYMGIYTAFLLKNRKV